MPNQIQNIPYRSTRPALNDVNDQFPFQSTPTASGSLTEYAAGLGARIWLDGSPSGVRYDATIGTLYGGEYQYVQFFNGTTAPAVGQPTAWCYPQAAGCFESYIVSCDFASANAGNLGRFAGVCINAVTKGNYGWIQVTGKASVLCTTLPATPVDGDMIVIDPSTGLGAEPTQSTTVTYALLKAAIGTAIGAPVTASPNLQLVLLRPVNFVT